MLNSLSVHGGGLRFCVAGGFNLQSETPGNQFPGYKSTPITNGRRGARNLLLRHGKGFDLAKGQDKPLCKGE